MEKTSFTVEQFKIKAMPVFEEIVAKIYHYFDDVIRENEKLNTLYDTKCDELTTYKQKLENIQKQYDDLLVKYLKTADINDKLHDILYNGLNIFDIPKEQKKEETVKELDEKVSEKPEILLSDVNEPTPEELKEAIELWHERKKQQSNISENNPFKPDELGSSN